MKVAEYSGQVGATVVQVSETPSLIGNIVLLNTTAAKAYLQIFWLASGNVNLGTTPPALVIPLPANGGIALNYGDEGWLTRGAGPWSIAGTTTRTGNTEALIDVTIWKN